MYLEKDVVPSKSYSIYTPLVVFTYTSNTANKAMDSKKNFSGNVGGDVKLNLSTICVDNCQKDVSIASQERYVELIKRHHLHTNTKGSSFTTITTAIITAITKASGIYTDFSETFEGDVGISQNTLFICEIKVLS